MPSFTFIPRNYLHFDYPISRNFAEQLATDPAAVARHSFLPFIQYEIVTQKISKRAGGGVELKAPKRRMIAYAAHKDAHIFTFYASDLVRRYESALAAASLGTEVTAFRKSDGRRNIHFANDAFNHIAAKDRSAVLALDITDFFGTIDHAVLKSAWASLLGAAVLPEDHYAVYWAITRYAVVDREPLCQALGLDPVNPRSNRRRRLCTTAQFRSVVRAGGLCRTNRSGRGIPQGSPISAVRFSKKRT